MPRRGEEFERTIFEFYRGIYPNCEVMFEHHVPDRDASFTPARLRKQLNVGRWSIPVLGPRGRSLALV